MTAHIGRALANVVIEAEDPGVQRALMAVAAWTSPDGGRDPEAAEGKARRMAAGWRALVESDPAAAEALAEEFRRYVRLVETLGITDPLAWEAPRRRARAGSSRAWRPSCSWPRWLCSARCSHGCPTDSCGRCP